MRIGQLRHKAEFQRAEQDRDAHGGVALTWSTYAHGWIGYEIQDGGESPVATKREATHRITVMARYIDGVKTTDRLKLRDRVFEILSAFDPDGRRRELRMICKEILNG
jgi:SPP1 family predicted phage head-tail adaptor